MSASVPVCTLGSEPIGAWCTQVAQHSCPFVGTSVLESPSSFACIFRVKEDYEYEGCITAVIGLHSRACNTSSNQAHRNARRGHDLKFLSLWGEKTPRTPVWRSKRRCQLDGWE